MSLSDARRVPSRPGVAAARGGRRFVALILAALLVAACGGATSPSFDPTGPCATDGHVPGAYPDLEALVPKKVGSTAPTTVDSGRNCTSVNLGTLARHGVTELRFAGGVFMDGNQSGVTLAVFQAPGLTADWIGEWYEASARGGRATGNIDVKHITVGTVAGNRMDLVNGESTQTVIAWPSGASGAQSARGQVVNVVIAAEEPETRIQEAIAAFGR